MTVTLIDFDGVEQGGVEGLTSPVGVSNLHVKNSPAPNSFKETYAVHVGVGAGTPRPSFESVHHAWASGEWLTISYYFQIDNLGAIISQYQIFAVNGNWPWFSVEITKTGDVKLLDANGTVKKTVTGGIAAGNWYLYEFKFTRGNTASLIWKINKTVVFDSTMDTSSSSSTAYLFFDKEGSQGETTNNIIGSYYFLADDGAAINTNRTFYGRFTVQGTFTSQSIDVTPDFGNGLSSGNWGNAQETPPNETALATYSPSNGASRAGGITTDNSTTGGPRNDSNVDGTIKGAKWWWRFKTHKNFFGQPTWWGKYGKQVSGSETTDNTTFTASKQSGGAFANYFVVEGENGTHVPASNEWFQIGFKAKAIEFGTLDVDVSDMGVMLLVQEPRRINRDGQLMTE